MDLDEIKSIIKIDGGKFIIVENNKPSLVVISFEDYKKHLHIEAGQEGQDPSLFQNTRDVEQEKSEPALTEASSSAKATEDKSADKGDDELTIDDLPL